MCKRSRDCLFLAGPDGMLRAGAARCGVSERVPGLQMHTAAGDLSGRRRPLRAVTEAPVVVAHWAWPAVSRLLGSA
jgi:hypothetical protein